MSAIKQAISLFSGAMGMDIGMEHAGIHIAVGQDIDKNCYQTMLANGKKAICDDIRAISPEIVLEASGLKAGEPFLICGGPPCQPFSIAGKRLGANDPRGSLFMDFVRMVKAIRPRFFVMENVKGLLTSMLKNEDGTDTDTHVLEIIISQFEKLGYKTVYGLLDAVNYGVPQFRERFILIGSRDNEDIFLPIPTHFPKHQRACCRWATIGDVIHDLADYNGEYVQFSPNRLKYIKMVSEGENWKVLPDDVARVALGGAYTAGGGKVGYYRRLSFSQPSPTLVTSPTQKATMMGHPTLDRPLSVQEYARIQQFPDEWKFYGKTIDKYRQLGNAVPVGLAQAIGEMLVAVADNTSEVKTKRFRGTNVHTKLQNAMQL